MAAHHQIQRIRVVNQYHAKRVLLSSFNTRKCKGYKISQAKYILNWNYALQFLTRNVLFTIVLKLTEMSNKIQISCISQCECEPIIDKAHFVLISERPRCSWEGYKHSSLEKQLVQIKKTLSPFDLLKL